MERIYRKLTIIFVALATLGIPVVSNAYTVDDYYYYTPVTTGYTYLLQPTYLNPNYTYGYSSNYSYQSPYYSTYYSPYTFTELTPSEDEDRPDVETQKARHIDDDSAELNGEVDMNEFRNGIVFFVYGQDEDMIEDVEHDYDTYHDVKDDEEDDDFEVVRVDIDLDGSDSYSKDVKSLESDEDYYFVICVEYEDEDNDDRLECGDVEDFETDR